MVTVVARAYANDSITLPSTPAVGDQVILWVVAQSPPDPMTPFLVAGGGATWEPISGPRRSGSSVFTNGSQAFVGTGFTSAGPITVTIGDRTVGIHAWHLTGASGTPQVYVRRGTAGTFSSYEVNAAEGGAVLGGLIYSDTGNASIDDYDPDAGWAPVQFGGLLGGWVHTRSTHRAPATADTHRLTVTVPDGDSSLTTIYVPPTDEGEPGAAYRDIVLADTPWVYWPMGDAVGSDVLDASPNARHGTIVGGGVGFAPPFAPGLSRSLDLTGQHVASIAQATTLGGSDATIEFWVRPTNLQAGQPRDLWSGSDENRFARVSDAGQPAGVIQAAMGQGGVQSSPAGLLSNDTTYHVVFRYIAASGVVAVFVDGAKVWETVQSANGFNLGAPPLRVARAQYDGRETRGRWSDFAAYRSALSDERIAAHYAAGSGAAEPVPLGQAAETDAAAALTTVVDVPVAVTQALETSHASTITPVGDLVVPLGQALEQDTAVGLTEISTGPDVTAALGQAVEIDVATRTLAQGGPVPIGQAVEIDVALGLAQLRHRGVTDNRAAGRVREGVGVASWTPAIAPPPRPLAQARVTAAAHGPVTMTGPQPTFAVSRASIPRHRHRVIIGGVDVTWFRGVETPEPSYQLAEPLLWGPATISLPQIAAAIEQLGVGELTWLRKGASVVVQRVDDATGTVVATDYRGIVVDFDISGRELAVGCGGHAQGRAAMRNVQTPIFSSVRDVGRWAYHAIKSLGLTFKPRLGPETGVELGRHGGTSHLEHITELCARAQARSGRRWTIMPTSSRRPVYRMVEKDTTTVHATVFVDDARTVPRLRSDLAEEPNRIYSTGVTPDGQRVRFGVYPGLKQTKPAPYPFENGRVFGAGTTNGDTDTGDGITVMIRRLALFGYLKLPDTPGGYDIDVTRAVRALQEDAGLLTSGDMTTLAWEALFDVTATGFDLSGSRIEPAAQRRAVRRWRRTPSGAIIGRNPHYDPAMLKVDRNVDMGSGMRRQLIRDWSKVELDDSDSSNWVGTIDITTGAVLAGDVPVGADITEADVLDVRDLRPGMNLRLANFDGGTLVHVAGINHPGSEGAVSLTVDTRARDALEVWEVIARNRETRSDPSRAWRTDARSSTIAKDSIDTWDEVGGILGSRLECPGRAWTIFEVVAGQEGSVSRLQLETAPVSEFVVAVFGSRIGPRRLTALVPHPLGAEGAKAWENRVLEREHQLLYAAGDKADPCGYHPGSKGRGANLLTGRWRDAAGFSYRAGPNPVLYVAVWPDRDTHILPGRIMWNQLEAGV